MNRTRALLACAVLFATGVVGVNDRTPAEEPYDSGWAFYIDNDAFAPSGTDRDYTGGFSLTLSGRRAAEYPFSIDGWRAGMDRLFGAGRLYQDRALSRHSMEVGISVFTPANITDP